MPVLKYWTTHFLKKAVEEPIKRNRLKSIIESKWAPEGGGDTTTHPLVVLLEGLEPGCVVLALAFLGVRHPCPEAARTRGPGYPRFCLTLDSCLVSLTTDVFSLTSYFFFVEVLRERGVRFCSRGGVHVFVCAGQRLRRDPQTRRRCQRCLAAV